MVSNFSDSSSSLSHAPSLSARSESVFSDNTRENPPTCCSMLCTLFSYALCLKRMSLDARLKVLWFWLIILPLSFGFVLRFHTYTSHSVTLSSSDLVRAQKISTTFCSGVSLKTSSYNVKISAYVFPEEPRINSTRTIYNIFSNFTLFKGENKTLHYHLLAGSSVSLTLCTNLNLHVYTVKSIKNMERLLETRKTWYVNTSFSLGMAECYSKLFTISESDVYYFIIWNNWLNSDVSMNLTLKRKLYQVNQRQVKPFLKAWKMFVPLDFHTSQSVVYGLDSNDFQEATITTHCVPRNPVYIGFFLILPLVLGLIFSCIFRQIFQNDLDASMSSFSSHRRDSVTSMDVDYHRPISEPPIPPPETLQPSLPPQSDNSLQDNWTRSQDTESRNAAAPPPSYESLFSDNANNELPSYQTAIALSTV